MNADNNEVLQTCPNLRASFSFDLVIFGSKHMADVSLLLPCNNNFNTSSFFATCCRPVSIVILYVQMKLLNCNINKRINEMKDGH